VKYPEEAVNEKAKKDLANTENIYYLFQGRPTAGNEPYEIPIVRGWEIFTEALRHGSGLARRARFVMSHETGKIEILAVDEKHIYLRYHRAKDPALRGQFMIYNRNDEAYWLDELEPAEGSDAPRFPPSPRFAVVDGPQSPHTYRPHPPLSIVDCELRIVKASDRQSAIPNRESPKVLSDEGSTAWSLGSTRVHPGRRIGGRHCDRSGTTGRRPSPRR